jgi:predicted tellurium resistance membrane protein TerC
MMPFILLSDWLLIALNAYWLAEYTHPLVALWGLVLAFIGLKKLLGTKKGRTGGRTGNCQHSGQHSAAGDFCTLNRVELSA